MTEEIYQAIIQELAAKHSNAVIESASYRARMQKALAMLEKMQAVLAQEPALQELFDETAKKMEEQHEHE